MLRKLLLSSALIVAAGASFAADLPMRSASSAYIAAAPVFTWTGFYVGLNAGGAWNDGSRISYDGYVVPPGYIYGGGGGDGGGFTGGAQVGYNLQFGSFVAGVEADINYLDRNGGGIGVAGAVFAPGGDYFIVNQGGGGNWFGTVRGRLGFAFDRLLPYVTGGLAFGGDSGNATVTRFPAVGPGIAVASTNSGDGGSVGWTLGVGVEYAFSNSMSFKLEYLHVDLGKNSRTFVDPFVAGATFTARSENKFDVVRAGVNFRF